ncbi:hypothetical protein K402DRAFT_389883 [Aulographum hederae CBS 113979]|uniref:Uncharacterized protein n=1 Tax=Aulographum hederae CBS 113979 TaxID=1176131 RepID=A0A6G1HAK7_9PEZI|nr:hypothetical protein K402DRAFT_389883 [Aulographum hederae CBS 113979]
MTCMLLFCTSEEAKPFISKVLDVKNEYGSPPTQVFYLVESRICPDTREGFKQSLQENETFSTDFIGASNEDCQQWALEKQFKVNFIEQDIIAIADARSAQDSTILIQNFPRSTGLEREPDENPGFGPLPREEDVWYDFRVDYRDAAEVYVDLGYGPLDTVLPTYFGRKEELTDEKGVFDVKRALRFVKGEEDVFAGMTSTS